MGTPGTLLSYRSLHHRPTPNAFHKVRLLVDPRYTGVHDSERSCWSFPGRKDHGSWLVGVKSQQIYVDTDVNLVTRRIIPMWCTILDYWLHLYGWISSQVPCFGPWRPCVHTRISKPPIGMMLPSGQASKNFICGHLPGKLYLGCRLYPALPRLTQYDPILGQPASTTIEAVKGPNTIVSHLPQSRSMCIHGLAFLDHASSTGPFKYFAGK